MTLYEKISLAISTASLVVAIIGLFNQIDKSANCQLARRLTNNKISNERKSTASSVVVLFSCDFISRRAKRQQKIIR